MDFVQGAFVSGALSSNSSKLSVLQYVIVAGSLEAVHSRTSRRRGQSWQQPFVVVSRQGVAVVAVVADVAAVSGVSGSSCSKCYISF